MKHNLFVLSLVLLSALFITSCNKDDDEKDILPKETLPLTLTVKEIVLESSSGWSLKSITVVDDTGKDVAFSSNPNNWFENATVKNVIIPAGATILIGIDNNGVIKLSLGSKAKFEFVVDSKTYSIDVGPQSKFVVKKTTTGKYDLLPNETVQLSSP